MALYHQLAADGLGKIVHAVNRLDLDSAVRQYSLPKVRHAVAGCGPRLNNSRKRGGFFLADTVKSVDQNFGHLGIHVAFKREGVDEMRMAIALAVHLERFVAIVKSERIARVSPTRGGDVLFEIFPNSRQ